MGWPRRAALDCRPPRLGQKKTKKKLKQQSSDGTGRVGRIGTARGVMEVTPCRPPVILVLFRAFQTRLGGGVQLQETDETGAKVTAEEGLQKNLRCGRA